MPCKDQTLCYRTFEGVRWPNLCDMLDAQHEIDVAAAKKAGVRIRLRKHPEGYRQAFFYPDDKTALEAALKAAPICNGHERIYEDGSGYVCRHCGMDMDDED